MVYVNENIKNTIRVFPQQNRYGKHRYDMNENPEGLPRDFVNSVLRENYSGISLYLPRT